MLEGIDYFGGDILFEQEDSPMHCAIRCRKEHACKRWTFAKVPKTGHCSLLKTNNASTASNLRSISGFKNSRTNICGKNGSNF